MTNAAPMNYKRTIAEFTAIDALPVAWSTVSEKHKDGNEWITLRASGCLEIAKWERHRSL